MRSSLTALALAVSACSASQGGPNSTGAGVTALYDTSSARSDFFALPWPSDARIALAASDGKQHLDLHGYYNPGGAIGSYLSLFAGEPATGFGTSSAVFFRFDGALDPATLPQTLADSMAPGASAFLVDVTPQSPTYQERTPVRVHYVHEDGLFIGKDSVALLPEPGFPLRERTTYAAVITDAVHGSDGAAVRRDSHFALPSGAPPLGADAAHVAVATFFTTADVTSVMRDLRAAVYAQAPVPEVAALSHTQTERSGLYDLYQGTYDAPNFQEGDPPYLLSGGRIHRGADGKPAVVRTETLRFAVTVPRAEMPPGGWPVVLYAHGTGGNYLSFVDDGSALRAARVTDDNDAVIARLAMISIDQVLHGPRDPTGTNPDLSFYNFQNLLSARDSGKQGALDDFSLLRLVEHMNIGAAPATGVPIRFDPSRIYFKGHSQGGTTGPIFLAFEPDVKAAVLSGAGAVLELALLGKTQPDNIPALVAGIVGEDVNVYHPLLNLMQTFLESADPNNYARFFFREPPASQAPKSIYQSLGIVDHYTPVPTIKALALAMGVQPSAPQLQPIDPLALTSETWATAPVAQNVAGGTATGVLCEYLVPNRYSGSPAYDGHFVVFNHPDAIRQSNTFLATHAAGGIAKLVP